MRRRRQGAAALEFALSVLVVVTMMVGVIDWAWYFYVLQGMEMSAWEGVRMGAGVPSTGHPTTVAEDTARAALSAYGYSNFLVITVVGSFTTKPSGTELRLNVTAPFQPPLDFFPMPKTVTATASAGWYGT